MNIQMTFKLGVLMAGGVLLSTVMPQVALADDDDDDRYRGSWNNGYSSVRYSDGNRYFVDVDGSRHNRHLGSNVYFDNRYDGNRNRRNNRRVTYRVISSPSVIMPTNSFPLQTTGINSYVSNGNQFDVNRLSSNMYRFHDLSERGRISRMQQQQIDAQLRSELYQYRNQDNAFYRQVISQPYTYNQDWGQYGNPGFLNYVNQNNPSLVGRVRLILGL